MAGQPEPNLQQRLKDYYSTSTRYRDDLITHDEGFLEPFLLLIERYVRSGSRLLDIGCGTGLSTVLLNRRGYETTGADLSPLFLSVEKQNAPDTTLIAANALQLPFPDKTFNAVVAFEFVEHVPDVPALLDEMIRVLRTPGYIILHSPNLISPYLPALDLIKICMGKGGRPVFAENFPQAWSWFKTNALLSLKKKFSPRPQFIYRDPDLSESHIGGDSDSVYLANQIDIARYLKSKDLIIKQLAHAMSLKNKFIATLTPSWAPYMGVVAMKVHD